MPLSVINGKIDSARLFLALQKLGSEVKLVVWGSSLVGGEMEMSGKNIRAEPRSEAWVAPHHPKEQV